jgi:hypothetical protein
MALLKKTLFDEKLETYNVLVEDTAPFSNYFKITELSDVFTGGKNAFLIQGSPELVADSLIKIQIKDSQGNTIYNEPGEGIPEYYEGTSKVVAVYIYPDTSFGPCTITILGELKEYYSNNGVLNPVPGNWEGTYNVRWQKQINVNPLLQNTSKIRFYRRPKVAIEETILPIYNRSVNRKTISGSVDGVSINPLAGANFKTFKGDTLYELRISGSSFSSSMEGETITITNLNQSYSTTIKDVITSNKANATIPYYETSSVTSPQIIKNFSSASFSLAYNESVTLTNSSVSSSFAKIKLTDLEAFSGDVNRLRIYASRKADIGNYTLLEDIQLESNELLQTDEYSGSVNIRTGVFSSQNIVNEFWVYKDYDSSTNYTATLNNTDLVSSVKLLDDGIQNTSDYPQRIFYYSSSLDLLKNTEYQLDFTPILSSSLYGNNIIEIYGSGSAFVNLGSNIGLGKNIGKLVTNSQFIRYDKQQVNFKTDADGTGTIVFAVYQGNWQLSNISLRATQETNFSPNEITLNVAVPTKVKNDTFDFKFEFYDINNNYVPVSLNQEFTFTGGNDLVVRKSITVTPDGNLFSFSGSGESIGVSSINFDITKVGLTGSTIFYSSAFDENGDYIQPAVYGSQPFYPGLLTNVTSGSATLTVSNFTGSLTTPKVTRILYTASCEDVQDLINIYRVDQGANGQDGRDGSDGATFILVANKNQFVYDPDNHFEPAQSNDFIDIKLSSNIVSGSLTITSGSFLPKLQKLSTTQVGFYTESVYRIYSGNDEEDVAMLGTNAASWSYYTPTNLLHKGTYLFSQNGFSSSVQLEGILKGDKSKNLNATSNANQFFYKMTDVSLSPSGQSITIDVKRNNLGSTTNAITVTSGSGKPVLTVGSNNGTTGVQSYSIDGSNYPYSAGATTYTFFAEDLNFDGYTDTITITPVIAESQIAVNVSNENTTFPAYSGGNVFGGFLASSGSISVKVGSEDIAYASTIANNRFSASISSSTNVTGVLTNNNYSITALSADSGSLNLKVTYRDGRGSDSTFTKLVTYSKAKAGAPNVLVAVSPSAQSIAANSRTSGSATPASVTVTALEAGTSRFTSIGTPVYTNGLAGDVSSNTITFTSTASSIAGSTAQVTIPVNYTDSEGVTGTKNVVATVSKALASAPSTIVSIEKDGQTITRSKTGTYGTPSSFRINVLEGANSSSYDNTEPFASSTFRITNVTNGTLNATDLDKYATITPSTPSSTSGLVVSITGSYVDSEGSTTTFLKTHNVNVATDGSDGATGASGPGIVFRGPWSSTITYFDTDDSPGRRDAVLYSGTYYATKTNATTNLNKQPNIETTFWESLGTDSFFVAAKIIISENSFVQETLNVGTNSSGNANITLRGGTDKPYISIAQAVQEFGTNGIYLGITGSVGNAVVSFQSGSNYFKYNSSAAGTITDPVISVGGNIAATYITATSGAIGGFTIGSNTMTAGNLLLDAGNNRILIGSNNNLVAMSPTDGFYAGSATPTLANFRVKTDGIMTAVGASITGTITATGGNIGGWEIGDGRIFKSKIELKATSTQEYINVQGSTEAGSAGNYVRITPDSLSSLTLSGAGDGVASTAAGTSFTNLGTGTTLTTYYVGNSGASTTLSTDAGSVSNSTNNGAAYTGTVSVRYKLAATFSAQKPIMGEGSIFDRPTFPSAQAAYQASQDNLIGISPTINGAKLQWNQAVNGVLGYNDSEYFVLNAVEGTQVTVAIVYGDYNGTETISSTLYYNNTAIGTNTKTLTLTGANTEVSEIVSMAGSFTQVNGADFKVTSTRTNGGFNIYRIAITWELGKWFEPDFNKPFYSWFPAEDTGGFEFASETTAYVAPTALAAGSLSRFLEITPSGLQAVFNSAKNYFRVDYVGGNDPSTSNFNINSAGYWKHTGEMHSTGDIIGFTTAGASDERLKDTIENITEEDYLKLKELVPVTYSWKSDNEKEKHYGLIAQQVDKVFPELTRKKLFGEYMTINYIGLIPILVGMIQKQNSRISELERRLNSSK